MERPGLDAWMKFFNAETEEDLDMLEQTSNEPIKKAVALLRKLSADETMQEKVRLEEKRRHDEASFLYTAREEGIAVGMEKGREKGREEGREEGINIGIGKSFMLLVKNGVDPKKAAELLDYSVTDFKDELYYLQDTMEGFNAEDYLSGEDEFEM